MTKEMPISDNLVNQFSALQNKSELTEVLKELFDKGKIYLIGDLSKDEIRLATRIYMIAKMKKLSVWNKGLTFYCTLMLSKDRKSRTEILRAIQGYSTQQTFFNKMNPFNWGKNRV